MLLKCIILFIFIAVHVCSSEKVNRQNISKVDQKIDILLHVHLVKVIWHKINSDKNTQLLMKSKKFPISVDFKFHLTEEIFANMREYSNVKDQQFGININQHFMNYLKIINKDVETFGNDPMEAPETWYETKYFVVLIVLCGVMSLHVMSKPKFFLLVVVFGFVHKGLEMYEDGEINKRFIVPAEMLKKCYPVTDVSYWGSIKRWFSPDMTKQCLEYERDVHTNSHHNANVFKVVSTVVLDLVLGVFTLVAKLVGTTYSILSEHLPWGLTPIFTLITIIMEYVVVRSFIIKTCPRLLFILSGHHMSRPPTLSIRER